MAPPPAFLKELVVVIHFPVYWKKKHYDQKKWLGHFHG
jgi:hypothetical protein